MPEIILPSDAILPADDLVPGDPASLEREDEAGRVAQRVGFRSEDVATRVAMNGGIGAGASGSAASPFGSALPDRIVESPGAIHYVSPTGSDSTGDGTLANPWAQPEYAVTQVGWGDTVKCLPGTYELEGDEQAFVYDCPEDEPITIEASDPANKPVFVGARFYFTSASYFRLRNLRIYDSDTDGVKFTGDSHHIELDGCEVFSCAGQGIQFSADVNGTPSDIQVWNTKIHDNGTDTSLDHGAYVAALTGDPYSTVFANCVFYNNAAYGLQAYPDADALLVTCCTFDDHDVKSGMVIGGDASDATSNLLVVGCIFSRGLHAVRVNWEGTAGSGNVVYDSVGFESDEEHWQVGTGVTYTHVFDDIDPLYVDADTRDYRLDSTSPIRNVIDYTRLEYVPATDFNGVTRGACPGAFAANQ